MPGDLKKLYSNILSEQRFCPLYCEPWWLDAICGEANWDIYFFNDNHGNTVACVPYYLTKVSGLKAVITPPMTQWLSVFSLKNTLFNIQDLLLQFDSFQIIDLTLKSEAEIIYSDTKHATNLKYSFVIDSPRIEDVRSKYNEGLRRNLKEADKNYSIQESDDIHTLIKLAISSYEQRHEKAPPWIHDVPDKVFRALQKEQRGKITFAMKDNDPVAGIMTGWDATTAYYLLGGRNETGGASAHAYLLDDAVSHAVSHERKFDFEGSMHPGIANFFQSFGAKPAPYIRIRKYKGLGKIWSYLHK